jgi:hypothetical protein
MAKKESDKKALKAIDKAVKKAIKNGVTGGLVDQTVATAIRRYREGRCEGGRS